MIELLEILLFKSIFIEKGLGTLKGNFLGGSGL